MSAPRGIGAKSFKSKARELRRQGFSDGFIASYLDLDVAEVEALLARPERKPPRRTAAKPRRAAISEASPEQRAKVAGEGCAVRRCTAVHCDPAHLISRKVVADREGEPLRVVPLCREHHRAYDQEGFDLLPHLEPAYRAEVAHAVELVGVVAAIKRLSGGRLPYGEGQ